MGLYSSGRPFNMLEHTLHFYLFIKFQHNVCQKKVILASILHNVLIETIYRIQQDKCKNMNGRNQLDYVPVL